jgi:hypothetical protein
MSWQGVIDTSIGAFDYNLVAGEIGQIPDCAPQTDAVAAIARLAAGIGQWGPSARARADSSRPGASTPLPMTGWRPASAQSPGSPARK